LLRLLEESARLEGVIDAVAVVDDDVEPDVAALAGGGGGGGPFIMPNSPIEPKLDEAEVVPDVAPRLDSSCCIKLSMLLDMSARLEVVEAELVDEVEPLPLIPPILSMSPILPPGGGGMLLLLESLCICSRPDMVLVDRRLRK
jgi:hypothetical protein